MSLSVIFSFSLLLIPTGKEAEVPSVNRWFMLLSNSIVTCIL